MKNNVKSAVAITLTGIILLSTSTIKLNREEKYGGLTTTTSISLEQKSNNLNSVYSKKYSSKANELIRYTINKLEDNYEKMQLIYNDYDLPEEEEFIDDFIKIIVNNINEIEIVDSYTNSDYSNMLGNDLEQAFVQDGLLLINNDLSMEEQAENLIHGIFHFSQKNIINSDKENLNIELGMYNILTEGDSSWYSSFINSSNFSTSVSVVSSNNKICYMKGLGGGNYSKYSRAYNMLINLVGYSNMQMCKENYDKKILIETINNKYNIDGEKFIDNLNQICTFDEVSIDSIAVVENMYIECLEQELLNTNSKEDLLNFFNKYRAYRLQFRISCSENGEDVTNEVFNFESIDTLLLQKLNDYQLLPKGYEKIIYNLCLLNLPNQICENESASIYDINYYIEDNEIVLLNKTTETMEKYNTINNVVEYYEIDNLALEKSTPLISNYLEKSL